MSGATVEADGVSARLHRDWRRVAVGFAVAVGAVAVGLASGPDLRGRLGLFEPVVEWAVPAVAVAGFTLWFCRRHLDANRADGDPRVYPRLGLANGVTLGRAGLFAALAGFLAVEPSPAVAWLPAACYGTGCVLDIADGAVARRRGRTTVLGAKLDMAVDTMGFLVAPLVAVAWGRLPVWYLSLSAARYLFNSGCWLRRRRGLAVGDLPDSALRRPLAGAQMFFITLALAPLLPVAVVRPLAAAVLAPSLTVFVRDYLAVAGHLGRAAR